MAAALSHTGTVTSDELLGLSEEFFHARTRASQVGAGTTDHTTFAGGIVRAGRL